jgi:hypothetical protein
MQILLAAVSPCCMIVLAVPPVRLGGSPVFGDQFQCTFMVSAMPDAAVRRVHFAFIMNPTVCTKQQPVVH